jgi:flavin reductase (DIM6/NTAB) family NADH-FMN oxidoreductase RutF
LRAAYRRERQQSGHKNEGLEPVSHLKSGGIILRFGYDKTAMVTSDQFRQVMANFASGITVVTTRDGRGNPYGLTVSAFTSVSLDPTLVLVCLDNKLSGLQAFKDSKHFGISFLSEHQEDLSRMFAKKDSERPPSIYFDGKLGMPLLHNSIAVMECETVNVYEGGDHQIFLGEVMNAQVLQLDHPLLYFRGKYQRIKV